MSAYATYLEAIVTAGPMAAQLAATALLATAGFWAAGLWLPALLERSLHNARLTLGMPQVHGLALATGIVTTTFAWTAVDLIHLGRTAVVGVSIVLPALGIAMGRATSRTSRAQWVQLALLGGAAMLLALWLHLPNDLPVGSEHRFGDLQMDLPIHALTAEMIRASGLPLANLWATVDTPFNPLAHTAHAVALGGLADTAGINVYRAATVLWIVTAIATAWSVAAIVQAACRRPSAIAFATCFAFAIWAPLTSFDPGWLLAPPPLEGIHGTELWVAGRSYWNITQALSIAIVLAALSVLDRMDTAPTGSAARAAILAAGALLVAASASFKPSLVIFYGPALLLWCALRRESLSSWLALLTALALPLLAYALPAWLETLPSGGSWLLDPDRHQALAVAEYVLRALAAPLLVLVGLLWLRPRPRLSSPLALATIALGGSILFGMLFKEVQFIGFQFLQPNIWWGIAACGLLVIPLVARELPRLAESGSAFARIAGVLALALAGWHVAHGMTIATAYPVLAVRTYPSADIETLQRARELTSPTARLAVDPYLDIPDLLPFLARRTLLPTTFGDPADRAAYDQWYEFATIGQGDPRPLLSRLDGIIAHKSRRHIPRLLLAAGALPTPLAHGYVLWLMPGGAPPPAEQ